MLIKSAALNKDVVLKPHQIKGAEDTDKNNGEIVLAWKPGGGKTLGSMAAFEKLKSTNKAHRALVITPPALKDNYLFNGINKFSDSSGQIIGSTLEKGRPGVVMQDGILPDKDYTIMSNEMFRTNPEYFLDKTHADTVILDEAQKYRDPESFNYTQMMKVRPKFKNMILMTGTPISNHPRDVLPLLDLTSNKKHNLGNYENFDKNFIFNKEVTSGPLSFLGIGVKSYEPHIKNKPRLKSEIKKYVSSYFDEDMDMPKKIVNNIDVPMSDDQSEVYNWVMHKHINPITRFKVQYNLPMGQKEAGSVFESLLKARQASNSIGLFKDGMTPAESAEKTPKVKRLLEDVKHHLDADPKNKALIYSNFIHGGVDVLDAGLNTQGIKHGLFTGTKNTSPKDRNKAVEDYLAGNTRAFVFNQAGAEGLNLPGTTAQFDLDGHFNPAMQKQFDARGIRTGSPVSAVQVNHYKTVMPDTRVEKFLGRNFKALKMIKGHSTDEWVYETAKRKDQLNNELQDLFDR